MIIDFPRKHHIPGLKQIWKRCFSDPCNVIDAFFTLGFDPQRSRVVLEQDSPLAALYWFDFHCDSSRIAYLYAVATHPDHQGKGLCRSLLEDTHRVLASQGYDGAILVPGSESLFRLYEKCGYKAGTGIAAFSCQGAGAALPFKVLTAREYLPVRQEMLPEQAAMPDSHCILWLDACWQFYKGNGWLLAGAKEGDTLLVQEFFGDPALGPAITATLGASRGQFRMPGEGKAFSLWYSFRKDAPAYFGPAMD